MSREDADDNIARLRRRIAAGQAGQAEESRSFTRSEYARAKKKIDGMVAEGEISREAADTRLGQMRRMIVRADAAPQEEEHREFDWESTKERIEAAVEAGDITREQADARYAGIKKRIKLGEKKRGESRTFTQEEYEAAEKKIKAMVEQGKASAEDAEKRLGRMRQAMEKR
jgi:polyhydroxyalkanoate synthesis regulator phasin